MPRRLFISFEGGDGAGKSTQASILHDRLVAEGYPTVLVHEPGSTELGLYLRKFLKSKNMSREAELLLFQAARVELVNSVIRPSLKKGTIVIADRYADSSLAYQGYGRKIKLETVEAINSFATGNLTPDITFLLDNEPEQRLRLVHPQLRLPIEPESKGLSARTDIEGQRRFEDQPLQFHKRVRDGYLQLAKRDPDRWVIIDAGNSVPEVSRQVWNSVVRLLTKSPAI